MTVSSLDWGSPDDCTIVGREVESKSIAECIDRSRTPDIEGECLVCHGLSGMGKSHLLRQVVRSKSQPNDLIGFGKFGQGQNARPFSAIIDAMTRLLENLADNPVREDILLRVSRTVEPADIKTLVKTIPFLREALGDSLLSDSSSRRSGGQSISSDVELRGMTTDTAAIRFRNVFRRLLHSLGAANHPLIFVLDDCQWADGASRSLLESVMMDPKIKNVLVLVSVRDGESTTFAVPEDSPFRSQTITCTQLSTEAVTRIISKAMRLKENDDSASSLGAILHERCDGNPLFIKQYMELLVRDHLVWYSSNTNSFDVDMPAIVSATSIPLSVGELLASQILLMDDVDKILLVLWAHTNYTISHGALVALSSNHQLVKIVKELLVTNRNDPEGPISFSPLSEEMVTKLLDKARVNGLIERSGKRNYKFSHDCVQQAALQVIPGSKAELSASLGLFLHELSKIDNTKWMKFAAVNLLTEHRNNSVPLDVLGTVCLEAASSSFEEAAFDSAIKFADHGIKVLGDAGWKKHYDLMVDLYNTSAKSCFSDSRLKDTRKRIGELRKKAKRLDDYMDLFEIYISTRTIEKDYVRCLDATFEFLDLLGVSVPKSPSLPRVLFRWAMLKRRIKGPIQTVIEDLPRCENKKMDIAMTIINQGVHGAYWQDETNLLLWFCLLGMDMMLQHGISDCSPINLNAYGAMLGVLGQAEESYDYGKLAYEMALSTGVDYPRVRDAYFYLIAHLKEPIADIYKNWSSGKMDAVHCGDSMSIGITATECTPFGIVAGTTMWEQRRELDQFWELLAEFRQTVQRKHLAPYYQMHVNMMQSEGFNGTLNGEYFHDNILELAKHKKRLDPETKALLLAANKARTIMLYISGSYAENAKMIELHKKCVTEEVGSELPRITHGVFVALNYLALVRETGSSLTKSHMKLQLHDITKFDVFGSGDIKAFVTFIEAERLSITSEDYEEVSTHYRLAIERLGSCEMYLLEAKATERLGDYFVRKGRNMEAEQAINKAWELYRDHGVLCMREQLLERYGVMLDISLRAP